MAEDAASYGEVFATLLTRALKREEAEFKALKDANSKTKQTVWSVWHFYEGWLSVPLAKEALRDDEIPEMLWEKNKVDLRFVDDKEDTIATFQLKFKDLPLEGEYTDVVDDFRKQSAECRRGNAIEHYVVLVLCGSRREVET